ncbi:MAG: cupin domain-containing protein [Spirochaetales bacterium]|nr:cupin domain-containing protein [Spirochaetales bacterium]
MIVYRFGEKLREIRERRGYTLKQVAEKAGVSESLVSQIERNKVSPSIDTLLTLAGILEIDFEYLFEDFRKEKPVTVIHREERRKIESGPVAYEQLSVIYDTDEEHAIEAFLLVIQPGGRRGEKEYGHMGKELGLVLAGEGTLEYGKEVYRLKEGDSVSFSSNVPHLLTNTGKGELKTVWVSTPPRMAYMRGDGR